MTKKMKQITPAELKNWMSTGREFSLVDVREPWEHAAYNIGGELIPMGDLVKRLADLPKESDVVLYCEKGIRSVLAIQRLETFGYTNLINLSGGMKAWREA